VDWGNILLLVLSGAATLIGAVSAFRSGESSSRNDSLRTQLEAQRVVGREPVDALIQNAQNVNIMSANLNERLANREQFLQAKVDTLQAERDRYYGKVLSLETHFKDYLLDAEHLADMVEVGNGEYPEKVHAYARKVIEASNGIKEKLMYGGDNG
jgi:hypothetical protein